MLSLALPAGNFAGGIGQRLVTGGPVTSAGSSTSSSTTHTRRAPARSA
jgi:hypothetical protein